MRRRELITIFGASLSCSIAGCAEPVSTSNDREVDQNQSADKKQQIRQSDVEATNTGCSESGEDSAEVITSGNIARIRGILIGESTCETVRLETSEWKESKQYLLVHLVSVESDEKTVCSQCRTSIEYSAKIEFKDEVRGEVIVKHNGTTIYDSSE